MTFIQYDGEYSGVVTPEGVEFKAGEPTEVSEELAKALVDRPDFKRVPKPAASKPKAE